MGMIIKTIPFNAVQLSVENNLHIEEWKLIVDHQDHRSASLNEVDFSEIELVTCVDKDELRITGEEKLNRLKKDNFRIRYGASVFMGLLQDLKEKNGDSVLENLYKQNSIDYLDFFGDIVCCSDDYCGVLFFYKGYSMSWDWSCRWILGNWSDKNLSAVSPKIIS